MNGPLRKRESRQLRKEQPMSRKNLFAMLVSDGDESFENLKVLLKSLRIIAWTVQT